MPSAYYRIGSLYWDTTNKVLYYCTVAGDKTTSTWVQVGGSGSAGLYAITTLANADYFAAAPITVSFVGGVLNLAFGAAINVAKHNRMRLVASELIDGVTISYSAYSGDNARTASDGTNTETQVTFPRYTTMATLGFSGYLAAPPTGATAYTFLTSLCVIKAITCPTGILVSGTPVTIEEITPRVWARKFIQP